MQALELFLSSIRSPHTKQAYNGYFKRYQEFMGLNDLFCQNDPRLVERAIKEFEQAFEEIKADQTKIPIWQARIARFPIAFIKECRQAIEWSNEIVTDWLLTGMFSETSGDVETNEKINRILIEFGDHALTKSHSRHISADRCNEIGLKIEMLESDQNLQEAVLTLHHITMMTLGGTRAVKIIENHNGKAYIQTL